MRLAKSALGLWLAGWLLFPSLARSHSALTVQFRGMNPHVGQKLELRVVDKATQKEVGRISVAAIAMAEFDVNLPDAIDVGGSYLIDFYADLNQNGRYDSPPTDHAWRLELDDVQGDTTLIFNHNTNFTEINWVYLFALDLTNMNPHLGQKFEARLVDIGNGTEVGRVRFQSLAFADFSIQIAGLQIGRSYHVDFYADLNQNGLYDPPPTDHTWRLDLNDVQGDTTLSFDHNTNFTDIDWVYEFTLQLQGMNPHVGQKFEARVIDLATMKEVGRTALDAILVPDFAVAIPGIQAGGMYWVDFYADLNQNGLYDSPPTDHTWREPFTSNGDASVNFTHNTNFTEIDWVYLFTLALSNMNPHVGQKFEARVIDLATMKEVGRTALNAILVPDFAVAIPGIQAGGMYWVDFYADLNQNGLYDSPPTDHTWREPFTSSGDASVSFTHNTTFTEINWVYLFTLDLSGMNPHVGQKFELRVVDQGTGKEVGRTALVSILVPDFSVSVPGVMPGNTYEVDYYADLNQNGLYDAPPTDHAWRDMLSNTTGDASLAFTHNTNFTDIDWVYLFTLELKNMNPHVGQLFELRVVDQGDDSEVGRTRLVSLLVPDFSVYVPGLRVGKNYRVDYYADLNQNGMYDPPPTDHAWRDTFTDDGGDETLVFEHNTNFTDIQWPPTTAVEEKSNSESLPTEFAIHANYPNPFNPETRIRFDVPQASRVKVEVFNGLGQRIRVLVDEAFRPGRYDAVWDGRDDRGRLQGSGVYFYRLQAKGFVQVRRMLLLK